MAVLTHFKNVSELNAAISEARVLAENEAIKSCGRKGCLRSRGMSVKATSATGDVIRGEAESWCFAGKAAEFTELADMLRYDTEVVKITIDGGFNWAESVRAMNDHDYEPFVSEWSVEFGFRIPGDFKFNSDGYYVAVNDVLATIGKAAGNVFHVPKGHAWFDRVAEASSLVEVKGYHDELEEALL